MKYDKEMILKALRPTIQGLRKSINMLLSSGNYNARRNYKLSDKEFNHNLGVVIDMLHDMLLENVVVSHMFKKHPKLKKDFETLRDDVSKVIKEELKKKAEEAAKAMKPRIIIPGGQMIGKIMPNWTDWEIMGKQNARS